MHLNPIKLFQSNYPLNVSNKQVHQREVISAHEAYSTLYTVFLYSYNKTN